MLSVLMLVVRAVLFCAALAVTAARVVHLQRLQTRKACLQVTTDAAGHLHADKLMLASARARRKTTKRLLVAQNRTKTGVG